MSSRSLDQSILIRYDRRKQGFPAEEIQPGAHTGTRELLETQDVNIVYVNFSTGDDSTGDGSSGSPFKTYSKGVAEVGSTSKTHIEWQTNDIILDKITEPVQSSNGFTPSLSSGLSWASSADTTFSTGGDSFNGLDSDSAGKWNAGGNSGILAFSSDDGATWTTASTNPFTGSDTIQAICTNKSGVWLAGGNGVKIAISTNGGIDWIAATTAPSFTNINAITTDESGNWVAVGASGGIAISSDNGDTWAAATTASFGASAVHSVTTDKSGNWVAGGISGKVAFSSDNGDTWTQATTPFSGSTTVFDLTTNTSGRWVGVSDLEEIRFSTDNGDNWTISATTSFNSSNPDGIDTDEDGLWMMSAIAPDALWFSIDNGDNWTEISSTSDASKVVRSDQDGSWVAGDTGGNIMLTDSDIDADVSGFIFIGQFVVDSIVELRNCTATADITSLGSATINKCEVTSDINLTNAISKVTNTLIIGDVTLTGIAAASGDILVEFCTIIGNLTFANSGSTGVEQIQNTIIQGNASATVSMSFQSGNLFNGSLNLVSASNRVSFVDPLFIDAITYRLQRETGYTDATTKFDFDSPLIAIAADHPTATQDHQNSASVNRDYGAWSFDDSSVTLDFTKKHLFPKPANDGGIVESFTTKAIAHQAEDGVIDVANDIDRRSDEIVIRYDGIERDTFEFAREIERLRDTTVFISLTPDILQDLPNITVDGVQSIGDVDINIDAQFVPVGSKFDKDGVEYFVLYVTPNTATATQLILNKPLESVLADDEVIDLKCPQGIGEYKLVPPTQRSLTRPIAAEGQTGLRGFSMRFVRKCL